MIIRLKLLLLAPIGMSCMLAQDVSPETGLLSRRYRDGDRFTYVMKGENSGSTYEVQSST